MNSTIATIITEELVNPKFEMTRQYLKVLEIEYENGIPKIDNIETEQHLNQAIAYVSVKHERFYLRFTFDTQEQIEISSVDTAPFIGISFDPSSENLSVEELMSLTTIKPSGIITKGDFSSNGKFKYSYNRLEYTAYSEPGRLDSKLNTLLDVLEVDIKGIKELSQQTGCKDLFITIVHHIGNGNFTGLWLDNETINRLSKLGLQLTFDLHARGISLPK